MQLANIMNDWAKMHEGLNLEPEFTDVMFEVKNLEISLNDFKSREDDMEVVINEQNRIIEKLESKLSAFKNWSNDDVLKFIGTAFRHVEIKGDLDLNDVVLGLNTVIESKTA